MNNYTIPDDYYDFETSDLLYKRLTELDKEYITNRNEEMEVFLFSRWRTIINSFPDNYTNQYTSKPTQRDRNDWFKKYLDYPTKDISQMPEVL